MSYNQIRLELDPTGLNINNRIKDEPHVLSDRPTRSIAPNYGAFFATSLVVKDGTYELVRGQDYQIVELHQEATLTYGKEISTVILVINSNISTNVTIDYQALGGHYARSDESIARLYQTVISDNRPVDWTNVFNKPTEFTPTIHRHLLDDVYGFEPIVDYLERIKRAITLGQTQVVMEIVNGLMSTFDRSQLAQVIPTTNAIQHDALLYVLSRNGVLSDISVDVDQDQFIKGQVARFFVNTSAYPEGTTFYWEFYKPDSTVVLFPNKNGQFLSNGGVTEFNIYVPSDADIVEDGAYIGIKLDPEAPDYMAVTYKLSFVDPVTTTSGYGVMQMNREVSTDFDSFIAYADESDETRIWHTLYYV